jgi:hypothetical protein
MQFLYKQKHIKKTSIKQQFKKTRKTIKGINMKTITLIGFSFSLGWCLVLLITWFTAFFNPEHAITIFINRSGEMGWELILVPTLFIFMFGCLVYEVKGFVQTKV